MNNQLEVIKSAFKDKKKRTQNLILLVVLLVILLISCNYIFKSDDKTNKSISNSTSSNSNINGSEESSNSRTSVSNSDLENKLSVILSQIQGISDVSIVLSYSQEEKQNILSNIKKSM